MKLSTTLSLIFSVAGVANAQGYGPYNITHFRAHCVKAICHYKFNIAYAPDAGQPPPSESYTEPAFTTSCTGSNQENFAPCAEGDVLANLTTIAGKRGKVSLAITHTWNTAEGPETTAHQFCDIATKEISLNRQKKAFQIETTQQIVDDGERGGPTYPGCYYMD